jgi:hypothetical protein
MVVYEDTLPLSWLPGRASAAESEAANLIVLESVAAVEEGPAERLSEEHPEIQHELRRLDARLQLLIDMVARLLHDEEALESACRVRIGLKRIEFPATAGELPVGEEGVLTLQIHPAVPARLALHGHICADCEQDQQRWVSFEPDQMSESLRDALSRHVFRHHRRQVAATKRQPPTEPNPERGN